MRTVSLRLVALFFGAFFPAVAAAADLPTFEPAAPPIFQAERIARNWSGFSAGAFAGWTWADIAASQLYNSEYDAFVNTPSASFGFDAEGFNGGVQVGYDHQWGALLAGAGAEIGVLDLRKSIEDPTVPATPIAGSSPDTEFSSGLYGAVTGRLGVAFDRFLVYGRAGVAFLDADGSTVDECPRAFCGILTIDASGDDALFGWTAGAGVELALTDRWSIGGEYRYFDFGDLEVSGTASNGLDYAQDLDVDMHTARAFANYRW